MGSGLLKNWTRRPVPERKILTGQYVTLEPLEAGKHGNELYEASTVNGAQELFRYLPDHPPSNRSKFDKWLEQSEASTDPLFFAVIDNATGKVGGRQALQRIDPENGAIQTGSTFWGPLISRTPAATEAQYLFMCYVFDQLGYRRLECKCHSDHEKSRRCALRLGFVFEGIHRQQMVFKGGNRDTAWFSIIDKEWPHLKAAIQKWLRRENFDGYGKQIRTLEEIRKEDNSYQ
ncbi:acetyltransferase (GNAT) domain-containing protein [Ditylenchus destructor]|nr:acetyltransferase (GNAT) domain-containing protein [Ditylenchus destructor]